MPKQKKLKLRQLKSKNNKVKSLYLHLCDSNKGRARALATFTVPAMTAKQLQLYLVKEMKNYFAKRLQNLKVDVQYFSVIELGQYKSNPHLHFQLFYEKEDYIKVEKAYKKTIDNFLLVNKRCKLVKEAEGLLSPSSTQNYIIKEFDNTKLSDKDILDLDSARRRLKQGESKHIQFFSKSRSLHPHPLYKTLWHTYGIKYLAVNKLMNDYASRLTGLQLMKARKNANFPYIIFKGGAIEVDCVKIYNQTYNLALLTLFYMYSYIYLSSEKSIYNNKRNNYLFYLQTRENFNKISISRSRLRKTEVKTLYTVIII